MSTNPTSFRYPFESQIASLPPEVQQAHRFAFNGILDLNNAIAALKGQINAIKGVTSSSATAASATSTATETVTLGTSTTTGVTSFNAATGAVTYFPGMGYVNPQAGVIAYTTQSSDNGKMIVLGDASPIAVTLNSGFAPPWFTTVSNQGAGTATLTPSAGMINGGASITLPGGSWVTLYLDGTNWTADAPGSTAGGVTQLIAGSGISLSPVGGTGVVTVINNGTGFTVMRTNKTSTYFSGVTYTNGTSAVYEEVTMTATGTGTGCDFELSSLIGGAAGPSAWITNDGRGGCSIGFWVPGSATFSATAAQISGGAQPYSISTWTEVSF